MKSKKTDELRELINVPTIIVLGDGRRVEVRRPTWRLELEILVRLSDHIEQFGELSKKTENISRAAQVQALVQWALQHLPEDIEHVVTVLTGLTSRQIRDGLDLADILSIVTPFFLSRWTRLGEQIASMAPIVAALRSPGSITSGASGTG